MTNMKTHDTTPGLEWTGIAEGLVGIPNEGPMFHGLTEARAAFLDHKVYLLWRLNARIHGNVVHPAFDAWSHKTILDRVTARRGISEALGEWSDASLELANEMWHHGATDTRDA